MNDPARPLLRIGLACCLTWALQAPARGLAAPQDGASRSDPLPLPAATTVADRPAPFAWESFDFESAVGSLPEGTRAPSANRTGHQQVGHVTATRPDDGSSPIPTRLPPDEFPPVVSAQAMQDMALPGTAGVPGFGDPPLPIDGSASLRTFVPPVVAAPRPGADDRPTLEEPIPLIRRNVGVLSPLIDETQPPEPVAEEAVIDGPSSGYDLFGRCAHCGGAGCDQCSGGAGLTSPAGGVPYDPAYVEACASCCGFVPSARDYFMVDFLVWDRDNSSAIGGNFSGFNQYDETPGWRGVIGHRFDSNAGVELGYFGFDPWVTVTEERSDAGALFGNFTVVGGFPLSSISAFRDVLFMEQFEKSRLHSLELNRTIWGWDVIKTSIGMRYVFFDETYRLSTSNASNEIGFYDLKTDNHMIGPQLGVEFFYDVGRRFSVSVVGKIAAYANLSSAMTAIDNNGSTTLAVDSDATDFAWSVEGGIHGHYQLAPRLRARFGYDILSLSEVAKVENNLSTLVGPLTGVSHNHDTDAFFHGIFAGIEFYR